ncbi:MAG: hypothetical protein GY926_08510 [bacterium]|nr:hypothetical protein [bacterium]
MSSNWWRACSSGLAVVALLAMAPAAGATEVPDGDIMIIAAHPDDDIITAAGIISDATDNGQTVTIAYMTNGDRCATPSQTPANCSAVDPDIGDVRQDESVDALTEVLGSDFVEDNMIFLGYPGGFLPYLRNGTPLPGDLAHIATYADQGLNNTDWHDTWKGAGSQHALYTAGAISEDLYELLLEYRPDHIFTHSEFDRHSDHLSTYREVMEAIDEVQDTVPSYDPYVHTTIVHVAEPAIPLSWPASADPTAWHVPVPFLDHDDVSDGELLWASRESFEVPAPMQSTNLSQNPKREAIEAHATQAPDEGGFIRKFLHRDEVFWIERLGDPEGIADAYTVAEGGDIDQTDTGPTGVLANDVRGVLLGPSTLGPMTASAVISGVDHGTLYLDSEGWFTYTHDGSNTSSDSFTYRPKQGSSNGTVATVTITVIPDDEVPTADDDGPYDVSHGGSLTISAPGVLDGDVDPEAGELTAAVEANPIHGTLTLNANGSFTYVHNGTTTTADSFTYRAVDGGGNQSNIATVTLDIAPASGFNVSIAGSATGAEGTLASFTANVSGGSGSYTYDWSIKLAGVEVLPGSLSQLTFTPDEGGVYTVELLAGDGSSFATDTFTFTVVGDLGSSPFTGDIIWLANRGITRGCNADGTEFCPTDTVTRGQMAAFLVRALELTDDGGGNTFTDDDGSIFEDDIAKLAESGITRGCNAAGTKFCPEQRVTRGQMAAFLVRAFALTDDGGGNSFTDDDDSIFQDDIAKLAAAGITLGCNPPANTKFCPDGLVTRGQMAAFLLRAESWLP